jgi:hypothetical protein
MGGAMGGATSGATGGQPMPRRLRRCAGLALRASAARAGLGRRVADARQDDAGVTLILALLFIVIGALALTALVSFAGGALLNTANLQSERAVQYAADSATEIAIQAVRYRPDYYPTPGNCLTPTPTTARSVSIDTRTVAVFCSGRTTSNSASVSGKGTILSTKLVVRSTTLFRSLTNPDFVGWEITDPTRGLILPTTSVTSENNTTHTVTLSQAATGSSTTQTITLVPPRERTVTFYTCLATQSPCDSTNAIVTAVVNFNDSSTGGHSCTAASSQTCGTSMAIISWVDRAANH